jgi:hypothetical protein
MHYIQNSWFATNWAWMIMICLLGIAVVAYINNKMGLLKKSLIAVVSVFVLTLSISISDMTIHNSSLKNSMLNSINTNSAEVETSGVFSKVSAFLLNVIKDKIAD